jgi:hypothetical protein
MILSSLPIGYRGIDIDDVDDRSNHGDSEHLMVGRRVMWDTLTEENVAGFVPASDDADGL